MLLRKLKSPQLQLGFGALQLEYSYIELYMFL